MSVGICAKCGATMYAGLFPAIGAQFRVCDPDQKTNQGPVELVAHLPKGATVVSMAVHGDRLVVALADAVYMLGEDGVLRPIRFEMSLQPSPSMPRPGSIKYLP